MGNTHDDRASDVDALVERVRRFLAHLEVMLHEDGRRDPDCPWCQDSRPR
jgi:hypothetical protein